MKSEKAKMLAGELYNANDLELKQARLRARSLCQQLNALPVSDMAEKAKILMALFEQETPITLNQPFFCDYGFNIRFGRNVYVNYHCIMLDVAEITIGDDVLLGPNVQIYTATHPLSAQKRKMGLESGQPVSIGNHVWIGEGTILCPGVTIGSGSVIGAGSVVIKHIPPNVLAAGNPCKVIRNLPSEDPHEGDTGEHVSTKNTPPSCLE